jgi:hypothetical protein
MAVQRFVLDSTTLDNSGFGLGGASAFVLDTSTLNGTNVLDGGQFLTVATGSSALGGLDELGISSNTATITKFAVASASLGGLDASAQAKARKTDAVAVASLGGLDASATTKVAKDVIASASLGGLDASATTKVAKTAIASAALGGLDASATAQSVAPEPPYIPPSGSRWWKQPASPVAKHELPEQIVVEVPKPRRPLLVSAQAGSRLGGADVGALGSVTFSTLDDDAEVLLLV